MFYLFLTVGFITHIIRSIFEILKLKKIINPESRSLYIFMFCNMALLWISWFIMCPFDPYKLIIRPVLKYFGFILCISGLVFFFLSLFKIKTFENYKGELITYGIYKYIRHPMYLSFIFWLIGYPLYTEGLFSLIVAPLLALNVIFWKKNEEKMLIKVYPEYNEYIKRTFF
jgi:protein-S-isoprenylcysteine O-methyltransferase Ste14